VGHFERKFHGEGRSSINDSWRQKTRVPGLSRGVVCMILCLAVLIQYWRVTHTQTDRHVDHYYPRIASATRVKMAVYSVLELNLQCVMIFDITSLVRACLMFQMESCYFRDVTLLHLNLVINMQLGHQREVERLKLAIFDQYLAIFQK